MTKEKIEQKVNSALDELYSKDSFLFEQGLCERCINHKLAIHLEKQDIGKGYFVDCEYNKSHLNGRTDMKRVSNPNGNYIDIIVTKRNGDGNDDLVCFETKRWNNYNGRKKDRKNLQILTGGENSNGVRFGYKFGFYIIFGKTRGNTKIEVYSGGRKI